MELASLIIAAVAAIGTWLQIIFQARKDRKTDMSADALGSVFVIKRGSAIGIVCGLLLWSAATGYLAYRVVTTPHPPAINPQTIVATFNSNSWGLVDNRRAAAISVISTDIGPEAEKYRLVGIAIVGDAKVDINVDTRINRSSEYTIVRGTTAIEISLSSADQKRLKTGGSVDILVIALPQEYNSDQITSLSKLKPLRGQIVIHHGIAVPARP